MFVDRVRVHLRAGNGGAGVVSFVRAKGKPRGKPTGGSGGAGGDVIVQAEAAMATLLAYHRNPHHTAGHGTHGRGDFRHGRNGDALVLPVPPGTVIFDEGGVAIADLVEPGQRVTVLEGGRGGRGNAAFVGASHRAPEICEQGEFGRQAWLTLELKLIADAALVGFPNAGKSTLISRVSAAKPKVADYPFTTLEPHLGVVSIDEREFVLADVPGLIEGAADGRGLGHRFLRHVERARALVVLVDPSPLQTEPVVDQLHVLMEELGRYSPDLLERPRVTVITKADLPEAEPAARALAAAGVDALGVSAVTGTGLAALLHRVADLVEEAERVAPEREGFVLHRPADAGISIIRHNKTWVVSGLPAERAVAFADLTVPEAADLAARRLARLGVDRRLAGAGARPGDEVRIGELVFEFRPADGGEEE
ncbi:MAG: GTPase ObgE [Acidimicrobiia bacterium]